MSGAKLVFPADERVLETIRSQGLRPDDVKVVAGAAGGPKWLILGYLDRALFGSWFQGRRQPLYLLGSSIDMASHRAGNQIGARQSCVMTE